MVLILKHSQQVMGQSKVQYYLRVCLSVILMDSYNSLNQVDMDAG